MIRRLPRFVCRAAVILFCFPADASPITEKQCRIEETSVFSPEPPVTRVEREAKYDKTYDSGSQASKRIGLHRVTATLFNVHSKEALPVLDGRIPPQKALDYFFRCRGFGTMHPLDDQLLETALAAASHFKSPRIEIISAYRSPKFNDALAKKGRHVAAESKHTRGEALDFRLATADAAKIGVWLFANFEGGVGTYTVNNFVHIDTGAKRRWRGR